MNCVFFCENGTVVVKDDVPPCDMSSLKAIHAGKPGEPSAFVVSFAPPPKCRLESTSSDCHEF